MSIMQRFLKELEPTTAHLISSNVTLDEPKKMTDEEIKHESIRFLTHLIANEAICKDLAFTETSTQALKYLENSQSNAKESPKFLVIDASGKDGEMGTSGLHAVKAGEKGLDGHDGKNAENGYEINLTIKRQADQLILDIKEHKTIQQTIHPHLSIQLKSNGGNGGNGGSGGNGRDGKNGDNGKDATKFRIGERGENGGDGGDGGVGGAGGHGGNGGNIRLILDPKDTDLLILIDSVECLAGLAGIGGPNGKGGKGGRGGKGGKSYEWSQLRTRLVTEYDLYSKTFMSKTKYYYEMTSTSGGLQGNNGVDGKDAIPGMIGFDGMNGSFKILVDGVSYNSIYQFDIETHKIVDPALGNCHEFCEPGELVFLGLFVCNVGDMPKPDKDIFFEIVPTNWMTAIRSSLTLPFNTSLNPYETKMMSDPFIFQIDEPQINFEPVFFEKTINYRGFFPHLAKNFSSVAQKKDNFTICYPLQMGSISHEKNECTIKFTTLIKNICTHDIGSASALKRRAIIKATAKPIIDKPEDQIHQELLLSTFEIDFLEAKSSKLISWNVDFNKFKTYCLPIHIITELFLDKIQIKELKCIQKIVKKFEEQ